MYANRFEQVRAKVQECITKGNNALGVTLPPVEVRFDLKGRSAGKAGRRDGKLVVWFNGDMMLDDRFQHIINNTVPHEIAHSFCQSFPRFGSGHDRGWKMVCFLLGGNGERCHDQEVTFARGATYEYTTTTGHKVRVSQQIHNKIRKGQTRMLRDRSKGIVNRDCQFVVVS